MIPGFSNMPQLQGNDGSIKLKMYINIMDSMTHEGNFISSFVFLTQLLFSPLLLFVELDNSKVLNPSRINRIARGAGRSPKEVNELLDQFKNFEKFFKNAKGLKNLNPRNMHQISNMVPPGMMKQMGMGGLQNMLRNMGGNLGNLANMKLPDGFPGM
jgi:signal recognition particle subunit SRP54